MTILILSNGNVMTFTVSACADLYHSIYGGTLVAEIIPELVEIT